MAEQSQKVAYLVVDIEAVGDGELISRVNYPGEGLLPQSALKRYREELLAASGKDVLPPSFVIPVAVVVAKVSEDYRLLDVTALDEPEFRPHVLTRGFWQGWRHYQRPVIVTFNGRGYDLPVLELSAFRYGLSLPDWFSTQGPTYDQPRHRYNAQSHLDLMDLLSNYGAVRMTGGLNLLANLIGKPGKTQVDGSQVQEMYDRGETDAINGYCRCDVLDTYFVFLRTRVLVGQLTLEREQELVDEARQWLEHRRESCSAFDHYLKHWGDWEPPED